MSATYIPKKPKVSLTAHQFEILRIVVLGNKTPDPTLQLVDLDEILERVTRKTSKASMQFTIRALVVNGMILKSERVSRRGRVRVTFLPTDLGRSIGEDKPAVFAFVEAEPDDAVETFLSAA